MSPKTYIQHDILDMGLRNKVKLINNGQKARSIELEQSNLDKSKHQHEYQLQPHDVFYVTR